ncbi:MAG: prolyl oligopeptidase family serine peptidase [Symploca sp. SIO2E6]|nr:prolyl oligopeptidase family serine peptidase [Symploca sp. SIO2E6]
MKRLCHLLLILPWLAATTVNCSRQEPLSPVETSTAATETEPVVAQTTPTNLTAQSQEFVNFTNSSGWDKDRKVDDVFYDLYIPPDYGSDPSLPCLLVLPGWDFPRTSWVDNTSLVEYADHYKYALILPEMGKTLYESQYYPETQPAYKWNAIPGSQFIRDKLIPHIQETHNLLKPGQHNTMLGLSTGGRGVALIALENPEIFVAGASLSGDFSQENMTDDKLMTGVYGPFRQFSDRWLGRDNPQERAEEWKMPLYLAHGTADSVVPESQSRLFYEELKKYPGQSIVEYNPVTGAGHDYKFWGGQLDEVFEFLEKNK